MNVTGIDSISASDTTAIHEKLRTVGEGVFYGIGIEILIDLFFLIVAPAPCLRFDRPGVECG